MGKGGTQIHKAGIVVANFDHYSSRNLDPNVHNHLLVVNLGVTVGKTNALHSPSLWASKLDSGAIFRASLATRLQSELGVEIERKNDLFEIKGVPHDLMKVFSSRRETIQKMMQEKGWKSAKAAQIVTLSTRPQKLEAAPDTLLTHWRAVGRLHGFSTPEVKQLLATPVPVRSWERGRDEIVHAVKAHLEQLPGFTERELIRLIAVEAPGRGLDRKAVQALANEWLASDAITCLLHNGEEVFSLKPQIHRIVNQELLPDLEPEWEITD